MSEDRIRAFGWIAILGGLLNLVGYLFILSQPIHTEGQGIKVLEIMPVENVRVGVLIGLLALPSWLLVLPSLSAGIARARAAERWLAMASFTLFVAASVAFHSLYWPIAVAIQATTGSEVADPLAKDLEGILASFQVAIIVSCVVFTLGLTAAILRKCADYPWWVPLISPVLTIPTLGSLVSLIPAPYAGFVAAVTATFFSTVFVAGLVLARRPSVDSSREAS